MVVTDSFARMLQSVNYGSVTCATIQRRPYYRGPDVVEDTVTRALSFCPVAPWQGTVWRAHSRRYPATDTGGSLRVSGRYHRVADLFPSDQVFAALYTSVSDAVVTWEVIRGSMRGAEGAVEARLRAMNLARLRVRLQAALDVRAPDAASLGDAALTSDDYSLPQAIGAAALARGIEGLLVPSATEVGEPGHNYNVVILTDNLRPGSDIIFVDSRQPNLPR